MKNICIIIPVYNEQDTLYFLKNRLNNVINQIIDYKFNVLFVDDGSTDDTYKIMKQIRNTDDRFMVLKLSRNFGKEVAMAAGLDYCKEFDAVIIMDADLQDPPELILDFIKYWEEGYDDVYAQRRTRDGETWLKKTTSKLYYNVLQRFTKIPIQKDTGDFRLLDKRCVEAICNIREVSRCSKSIFNWIGYRKKAIIFDRDKRIAGNTKWNYNKLINLAIDGITSLSISPLKWAIYIGIPAIIALIIYFIYVIIKSIITSQTIQTFQTIILLILFFGATQIVLIGIIRRIFRKNF